jgi:hypothetical protein
MADCFAVHRKITIAAITALVGWVAWGCATPPPDDGADYDTADVVARSDAGKPSSDDDVSADPSAPPAAKNAPDPSAGAFIPVDPGPPGGAPADDDPPADAGAEGGTKPAAPKTKTMTCTAVYGSQKSTSKLTWTVSGTKATIKSLVVTVVNVDGRDKNDVDVWVDQPGSAEYKAFNSGDILTSGKAVGVPLPAAWTKPVKTLIRMETNFDQDGTDPAASCTIPLSP